jgi:hypothetical protein
MHIFLLVKQLFFLKARLFYDNLTINVKTSVPNACGMLLQGKKSVNDKDVQMMYQNRILNKAFCKTRTNHLPLTDVASSRANAFGFFMLES